ncbi:MAG: ferric reductase-like transmembrane domain-containing protein [Phycisphaerales bacterium]|nr:ferric reductase-like transmembrane domain-containing protein [Phycisphaerales bacterium]
MTNQYKLVQWNPHKKIYDLIVLGSVLAYLLTFFAVGSIVFRGDHAISPPILAIRALGTCAIVLLHVILCIGPLARFTPRMNALLYNRRHLGVTFFCVASLHALLVVGYYGGFGVQNPLVAVLAGAYRDGGVPYEFFGFVALVIFFVMAATSHDFWLANLGASFWKTLHMGVYIAYALVVLHVAFGAMRSETASVYAILLGIGVLCVAGLHLAAGIRAWRQDRKTFDHTSGWIDVGPVAEIPEDRARIVHLDNARSVAVFRYEGKLSAVSNVCAHQGGPLGEGKIVGGCITCPWHGYQYLPGCGQSPPPYTEKIPTYELRVEGDHVLLNPLPKPPGTKIEPANISKDGRDG